MKLRRVIVREILHRKLNFSLGVVSVGLAVACVVGSLAALQKHDARTEQIIAAKEAETRERMARLEDDYRKITKELGFNVLILPRNQNLSDLFAQDYATNTMPEEYVERLAKSQVATIQHLLPSLQEKLKWPEHERTIILMGVRGEVPILRADPKKPILEPVPPSTMVVGFELHRSLKLQAGDKVRLMGREFTVGRAQPERGTKDDITIWINLKEAQELLHRPGLINGILALECVCAADSLDKVRAEITRILPETQVIEFHSQTLARAEARQRAAAEAREAIQKEKDNRARLRWERQALVAVLGPVVVLACGAWIALLSLSNVRERRTEIGLWRALGVRAHVILGLFLGRAVLIGLGGAVWGYGLGWAIGAWWREGPGLAQVAGPRPDPILALAVLAGAPFLAVLASWLPSFLASQQDPAEVLSEA
jgi:putative ABC transport system permease protein